MSPDEEDLIKKLEDLGEIEVRRNLARGIYAARKKPLVENWLRNKEQERTQLATSVSTQHQDEQTQIARSAKDASWAGVEEAKKANLIAWLALYVSIFALIISLIGLLKG
ncbi:MAG: hypothetical protein NW215_02380 [Hyphomicrobiales bacterium]|nr:hypothetical protein [Hyphomicrobiales bacterium]